MKISFDNNRNSFDVSGVSIVCHKCHSVTMNLHLEYGWACEVNYIQIIKAVCPNCKNEVLILDDDK